MDRRANSLTALMPLPPGSSGTPMGLFASLAVYRACSHRLGSHFFNADAPSRRR
jgi:hypothetical protein